jgi:AcrR family transcriptional regulator
MLHEERERTFSVQDCIVGNARSQGWLRNNVNDDEARERLLAAAGQLFYSRGIHAVGMDDIREAAGLPLKRIYQIFPSKDQLAEAYLARRDENWLAALARHVDRCRDPQQRVLAVFTFLGEWFATPDFRGCAFINVFGELGSSSTAAAQITRRHKQRLRRYLASLASDAGAAKPPKLASQLLILMDGAIVSAATGVNVRAAPDARAAASTLLSAAARAGA